MWTGIGSVGTVVFGALLFHEAVTPPKMMAFAAIIAGALVLRLGG